jgi:hypothetical protein
MKKYDLIRKLGTRLAFVALVAASAGSALAGGERLLNADGSLAAAFNLTRFGVRPAQTLGAAHALEADSPYQNYRVRFAGDGVTFTPVEGAWRSSLALEAYGYGRSLRPVAAAQMIATGTRVEYRRGHVTEWYENGREGLRQWFRLDARPANALPYGDLKIRIGVAGDLAPRLARDGQIDLVARDGSQTLRYAGLKAWDANGRELETAMNVESGAIVLRVDDTEAAYPLTVDPVVQQARLVAFDGAAGDQFGWDVAIDGNTAVIGAFTDDNVFGDDGSAYVYVRSGGTWTIQQKLPNPAANSSDQFGYSVSISGDTLVVGARLDDQTNSDAGNAWVYVRTGTTWDLQARLDSRTNQSGAQFGFDVAIDGDFIVVGVPFDNFNTSSDGTVNIFRRSGTTWSRDNTQRGGSSDGRMDSAVGESNQRFGQSVAISGTTIVVGAPFQNFNTTDDGTVYVIVRNSGNNQWEYQAQRLGVNQGTSGQNSARLGWSVDVDGDTFIAGEYLFDSAQGDQGRAYVFTRSGGSWTRRANLENPTPGSSDWFGHAVAVDGNFAIVGAPLDDNARGSDAGAAYTYIGSNQNQTWTLDDTIIQADGASSDQFGYAVNVDGNVFIVGSFADDNERGSDAGSAWIYTLNRAPTIQDIPNQNATEDVLFTVTAVGSDPDPGNVLTYSLQGTPPAGMTINPATGVISWTPSETQGGQAFNVTVRVTDDQTPPLFAEDSFQVTVAEDNKAPVLGAIGNRSATEDVPLTFTATATDADVPAQTLTFSLVGAPSGASINATTGAFSWTPNEQQGGRLFTFSVRVTDNGSPARSAQETITVTVAEDNKAPQVAAVAQITQFEEIRVAFDNSATDADDPAQTITWSLQGAPAEATINPQTGRFGWSPTEADGPGTYTFNIVATDNGTPARTGSTQVTINILEKHQLQVDLNGRYFAPNNATARVATYDIDGTIEQVDEPAGTTEATFTPFSDAQRKPRQLLFDLVPNSTYEFDVQGSGLWQDGDEFQVALGDESADSLVIKFRRTSQGYVLQLNDNEEQQDTSTANLYRVRVTIDESGNASAFAARFNGDNLGRLIQLGSISQPDITGVGFQTRFVGATASRAAVTLSGFTTSVAPPNAVFLYAPEPFAQNGGQIQYILGCNSLSEPVSGFQTFLAIGSAQQFVSGAYIPDTFTNFFRPLNESFPALAGGTQPNTTTQLEGKLAQFNLTSPSSAIAGVGYNESGLPNLFTNANGDDVIPALIPSNTVMYESTPPTIDQVVATGERTGNDNLIDGNVRIDSGLLTVRARVRDLGPVASGLRAMPTMTLQFSGGQPVQLAVSHETGDTFIATTNVTKATPNGGGTLTITATDDCGNTRTFTGSFNVSQAQIVVTLNVQGLTGSNVTRAVNFVVGGDGNGSSNPVEVSNVNVVFSNGAATVILDQTDGLVRGSAYTRISVKDRLHTLRRVGNLTAGADPDQFTVTLSAVSGDTNDDNVIDILDFGILAGRFGQNVGRDTPGNFNGNRHPDFTGDGLVGTADALFITSTGQFLQAGDAAPGTFRPGAQPRKVVSVGEMKENGVQQANEMDLDRDGWITFREIESWLSGKRPKF